MYRILLHGWLVGCVGAGCGWVEDEVVVCQQLPEVAANQVLLELTERGIEAHKQRTGGRGASTYEIAVSQSDLAAALVAMSAAGLPRPATAAMRDLAAGKSWLPSPHEERVRLQAVITGELERSIELLDGVLLARVHLAASGRSFQASSAEEAMAGDAGQAGGYGSASVLIKYRSLPSVDDTAAVRALVVGAVAGLRPEHVAVVRTAERRRTPASKAAWAVVGPFRVAASQATALRSLLITALLLQAALVAALLWLWRRLRRTHGSESAV